MLQVSGAVILRPSLVFGPEDEIFNRFAAMAGFSPLIGGGRKLQPVFAGDVGAASRRLRRQNGTVYELGGGRHLRQLLDRPGWSGRRRRYLRVPFWAAKLGALLLPLPNSLRPLTVDRSACCRATASRAKREPAHARRARSGTPHHGGSRAEASWALPTPASSHITGVKQKPLMPLKPQRRVMKAATSEMVTRNEMLNG